METPNAVDEASRESFPASDAPASGVITRVGSPTRIADYATGAESVRWWVDGLLAGLLGFTATAAIFASMDVAAGRSPLYTVAVLGSALLFGAVDTAHLRIAAAPVATYTVAHLLAFLALGVIGARLVGTARARPHWWVTALILVVFVAFHLTSAVAALAAPMQGALPGAAFWVAGIGAGVAMVGYLVWARPRG